MNATLKSVAKHSMIYSYVLSQPFATYIDVFPALENKMLMQTPQLNYGQQGETVRILQKKLYEHEFYTFEIDGKYGIRTEYAIKQLQKQYNIPSSGQTDKVTIDQLLEIEKENYIKNITELTEAIYPGMKSTNVEIVQKALTFFNYYEGNIDGIYGPLTLQALQLAEDEHDLELVSEVTVQSLQAIYEQVEEEQTAEVQTITETNVIVETEIETETYSEQATNITEPKEAEQESRQIETYPSHGDVVSQAHNYLGTPYKWGGTSPSGFDCSGFIHFVFEQEDKMIPRTVGEIWNFSIPVEQPSVGDIVFFETYQAGASHAGIYIGNGNFIHASTSQGVQISELEQPYWKDRYIGANRIQ